MPFKAVFVVEYNQELLMTVKKQVDNYITDVSAFFSKLEKINDIDFKNSFEFILEIEQLQGLLPELILALYFLERSLVKATDELLMELFSDKQASELLNSLISLTDSWPSDKTAVFTVFRLESGQPNQFIFQLTDRVFQWVNSFVPISKKHEYRLFDDSFHKNNFLKTEESFMTSLAIQAKKSQLLRDTTKKTTLIYDNLLQSIQDGKLSLIIGDYGDFELKQFFYFFFKDIIGLDKRILVDKLDFFNYQFAEIFRIIGIVYVNTFPYYERIEQLIDIISSLRGTSSILVISEDKWEKIQSSLIVNDLTTYRILKKDLANDEDKEYLTKFTSNYLQKTELQTNSFENNDLIEAIMKKSLGSINYIDSLVTSIKDQQIINFDDKYIENLPESETLLDAITFKSKFMGDGNEKSVLLTIQGLATIQQDSFVTSFSKEELFEYYKVIATKIDDASTKQSKFETILPYFFQKRSNVFVFKSNKLRTIILDPIKAFNEELVDDFATKKLFLQISEFVNNLPELNFSELFYQSQKTVLISREKRNFLHNFVNLLSIKADFDTILEEISFSPEDFKVIVKSIQSTDTTLQLGKEQHHSLLKAINSLEFLVDFYLVQGDYEASNRLLNFLDVIIDEVRDELKIRIYFEKARQFLVTGNTEQSFNELDKSIILLRKTKSYWTLGVILRFMGEIYFINQQVQFGTYSFDQIFQLYNRILRKNSRFKAYSLVKLADRLAENDLHANALQCVEEATAIFEFNNLTLELINNHQKSSDLLFKLGSSDLAIAEIDKVITELGEEEKTFLQRLESIKETIQNPDLVNPFYSNKNWNKINYLQSDALKIQEQRYHSLFEEHKQKGFTEESLQVILQYIRILFKLGKIKEFKAVLDYAEHTLPKNFQNIGLIYLELALLYNFLGRVDVANYYASLTKTSIKNLPVDFDIRSIQQLLLIASNLYNRKFEYAELLLKDHLLRKKLRYEPYVYLLYAYLESHKKGNTNFDKLYDKGKSLLVEKNEKLFSKQEIRMYGEGVIFDLYAKLFPIVNLEHKEFQSLQQIHWLFYKMSLDGLTNNLDESLEKSTEINKLLSEISNKNWKNDIQINNFKRMGQIYLNDTTNEDNRKKSVSYWQKALQLIILDEKSVSNQAYLFEKLDLMFLIGKNGPETGSLPIDEANKYLLSGKNIIRKSDFQENLRLEFQFDAALGLNYYKAKDNEKAIKYFVRALSKHENKLYPDLGKIILGLATIYHEKGEKGLLNDHIKKYENYLNVFNIREEIEKLKRVEK